MLIDLLKQLRAADTPEDFRYLIGEIAEAFLDHDEETVDANEKRLFSDFVSASLDKLSTEIRALIIESISDTVHLEHDTANWLARHPDDSVAVPMIEFSPVFLEADLVDLAKTQPESRQIAIARRETVSSPVTSALTVHGTDKVLETLAANPGAQYTKISIARLFTRVGDNPLVVAGLASRARGDVAFDDLIRSSVDHHLRQSLAAMVDHVEPDAFDAIVNEAATGVAVSIKSEISNRIEKHGVSRKVQSGALGLDEAIANLCDDGRMDDCLFLLQVRTTLDEDIVRRNYTREGHEHFAIICRAAGLSAESYRAMMRLRAEQLGHPKNEIEKACVNFQEISDAEARRAVRLVKSSLVKDVPLSA